MGELEIFDIAGMMHYNRKKQRKNWMILGAGMSEKGEKKDLETL